MAEDVKAQLRFLEENGGCWGLLERAANSSGSAPAIGSANQTIDECLTYDELRAAAIALAIELRDVQRLCPGDCVALMGKNECGVIIARFACSAIGVVVSNLSPKLSASEIARCLLLSKCRWMIATRDFKCKAHETIHILRGQYSRESIRLEGICWLNGKAEFVVCSEGRSLLKELRLKKLFLEDLTATSHSGVPKFRPFPAKANTKTDIFFTSGSTGTAKGITYCQRSLLVNLCVMSREYHLVDGMRLLHVAPLCHVMGASALWVSVFMKGLQVCMENFDAGNMLLAIKRFAINVVLCTPTMMNIAAIHPDLATADLSSLTTISCGGAALEEETLRSITRRAKNLKQYMNDYGMTECGRIALSSPFPSKRAPELSDMIENALVCTGRPILLTDIRVISLSTGEDVEPCSGESGEIVVRNHQSINAAKIGMSEGCVVEDAVTAAEDFGWVRTGDVGEICEILGGFGVRILDRLKAMIITGGLNVYSLEVENVLQRHENVLCVGVYGVPDTILGETVHAVCVVEARDSVTVTSESLREFCALQLADYKVPVSIGIREMHDMPMSSMLKVQRHVLRQQHIERLEGTEHRGDDDEGLLCKLRRLDAATRTRVVEEWLEDQLARILPPCSDRQGTFPHQDGLLFEEGLDSFRAVALQSSLQKELGRDVVVPLKLFFDETSRHTILQFVLAAGSCEGNGVKRERKELPCWVPLVEDCSLNRKLLLKNRVPLLGFWFRLISMPALVVCFLQEISLCVIQCFIGKWKTNGNYKGIMDMEATESEKGGVWRSSLLTDDDERVGILPVEMQIDLPYVEDTTALAASLSKTLGLFPSFTGAVVSYKGHLLVKRGWWRNGILLNVSTNVASNEATEDSPPSSYFGSNTQLSPMFSRIAFFCIGLWYALNGGHRSYRTMKVDLISNAQVRCGTDEVMRGTRLRCSVLHCVADADCLSTFIGTWAKIHKDGFDSVKIPRRYDDVFVRDKLARKMISNGLEQELFGTGFRPLRDSRFHNVRGVFLQERLDTFRSIIPTAFRDIYHDIDLYAVLMWMTMVNMTAPHFREKLRKNAVFYPKIFFVKNLRHHIPDVEYTTGNMLCLSSVECPVPGGIDLSTSSGWTDLKCWSACVISAVDAVYRARNKKIYNHEEFLSSSMGKIDGIMLGDRAAIEEVLMSKKDCPGPCLIINDLSMIKQQQYRFRRNERPGVLTASSDGLLGEGGFLSDSNSFLEIDNESLNWSAKIPIWYQWVVTGAKHGTLVQHSSGCA